MAYLKLQHHSYLFQIRQIFLLQKCTLKRSRSKNANFHTDSVRLQHGSVCSSTTVDFNGRFNVVRKVQTVSTINVIWCKAELNVVLLYNFNRILWTNNLRKHKTEVISSETHYNDHITFLDILYKPINGQR